MPHNFSNSSASWLSEAIGEQSNLGHVKVNQRIVRKIHM